MIRVDRNAIPVPEVFSAERTNRERAMVLAEARQLTHPITGKRISLSETVLQRAQEGVLRGREVLGPDYTGTLWRAVRPVLLQLFHGKCAYCETHLQEEGGDVELFRPKAGARALDGTVDSLHYFWLVYEWDNTLIACVRCNRAKGSRFPIAGTRAAFGETDEGPLSMEAPILLNPCSDWPVQHLIPSESGLLEPASHRGEINIEVLNLNRETLIERRRLAWQETQALVRSALRGEARDPGTFTRRIEEILHPGQPFLLACSMAARVVLDREAPELLSASEVRSTLRQAIPPLMAGPPATPQPSQADAPLDPPLTSPPGPQRQPTPPGSAEPPPKSSKGWLSKLWMMGREKPADDPPEQAGLPSVPPSVGEIAAAAPASATAVPQPPAPAAPQAAAAPDFNTRKRAYSIEDSDQQTRIAYFTSAKRIERFTIRNFKAIEEISLTFATPESERESWLMLLGENGCGKSSILQALALTLMGQEHANALGLDARRYVRRHPGVTGGEVIVQVSGVGPIRLQFSSDSALFRVDPPDPKVLLLGYGATRLLPKMVGRESSQRKAIRILNLFDPTAPLADAESWLLDHERVPDEKFAGFRDDLIRLLMLPESTQMYRDNGQVEMDYWGTRKALRDMSDGFQSIVALAGDISLGVNDWWGGLREAEGIVLLDEIEVHLHPTWKISIVERLRQTCPRLSFVVTTHDPLCLKGLRSEEIVVLRKNAEREVEVITNIPRIDHLRADQLLGSFLFDLPSSRGSGTAVAVARYSDLLGRRSRTPAEDAELNQLRERLETEFSSALTPAQKHIEQAVRAALAPQAIAEAASVTNLELLRQVQELLAPETTTPGEGSSA